MTLIRNVGRIGNENIKGSKYSGNMKTRIAQEQCICYRNGIRICGSCFVMWVDCVVCPPSCGSSFFQ